MMDAREHQQIVNKQRLLPGQLARAKLRVRHLESEARRYGLHELVEVPHAA